MTIEDKELKDLIKQTHSAIIFKRIIVGIFLVAFPFIILFLKLTKGIVFRIFSGIIIFLLLTFIFDIIIPRQKNRKRIEEVIFIQAILDFCFLGIMVHCGGGIGWVVPFCYIGALAIVYLTLPSKEAFFLTLFAILIISSIALFEYFNILPHYKSFDFDLYNNFKYVVVTLLGFGSFLIASGLTLNFFSGRIRKKNELIQKTYQQRQEIRDSLEIKVEARKKELKELAKNLDVKIVKKTKELQNKIKELEKLNNYTVKRELKMVELKKEINSLKESLKNKAEFGSN